ncbi:mitochondrial 54S ribosomal protein YmL3 [Spizellomyces punctatus DAOM BR117]|uniref:Large ribosomal subunit protein mL44 n=1 Tax=Spizellomyces punctatus (strain DAOM BR117) TaxID=645134 RepID=A0A0L0HJM4_SPIPD|nr:mitochondrial 54S ribosomal protein YmL3 [Spizellomyces punctatus DAOM BR117]KND01661.1 hypothetical protein SPPG_03459 [Spizellomyces punctatus DAOM BR117]|eukprot:XP_016609700.1 hypothetical protein SPPG_03459 [Spizellomyces punctatus DAOM BR117]
MRTLLLGSRTRVVRAWCQQAPCTTLQSRPISYTSTPSPQDLAKLSAFSARTGFQFSDNKLLNEALTHKSFPSGPKSAFSRLQYLGGKVLGLYVTEHVYMKFPELPAESVESVVKAYIGDKALASLGKHFGIPTVMRWKGNSEETSQISANGEALVAGKVLQALIGALYQDKGAKITRQFVHAHFLSRSVDIESHLKLLNPKRLLVQITKAKGQVRPVSRLVKESGRQSSSPVFIVGIYSGVEKIGEGHGSSLEMAETRAVRDALQKHYLQEVKDIKLPSDLDEDSITFFDKDATNA